MTQATVARELEQLDGGGGGNNQRPPTYSLWLHIMTLVEERTRTAGTR